MADETVNQIMECRTGCAACCIAPSISSSIPGMSEGKPAGVRCAQLTPDNRCRIFGKPERPAVCGSLRPEREMCGADAEQALQRLAEWERLTCPGVHGDNGATHPFCGLEPGPSHVVLVKA